MIKKISKIAVSLSLLLPALALAQPQEVPETNIDINRAYQLFVQIMNWVFSFGIVLAVILIIWGGISYMTAQGDETKVGAAKKRIIYSLVGVAIIVAAWGIIYFVASYLGVDLAKPQ